MDWILAGTVITSGVVIVFITLIANICMIKIIGIVCRFLDRRKSAEGKTE